MNEKPQLPPPRPPSPGIVRKHYKQQHRHLLPLPRSGFGVVYRSRTILSDSIINTIGHGPIDWVTVVWRSLSCLHNWKQLRLLGGERRGEAIYQILRSWSYQSGVRRVNISHPEHRITVFLQSTWSQKIDSAWLGQDYLRISSVSKQVLVNVL